MTNASPPISVNHAYFPVLSGGFVHVDKSDDPDDRTFLCGAAPDWINSTLVLDGSREIDCAECYAIAVFALACLGVITPMGQFRGHTPPPARR